MQKKAWNLKKKETTNLIKTLLENRGFSDISELDNVNQLHDPYLFINMQSSVDRILQAIKQDQRIMIFGDYDVDGITGTAILVEVFKLLKAKYSYRIPNRDTDGYGLSKKFIQEFIDNDVSLLITVDCGISCFDEVELANKHSLDVIITDHHHIPNKVPNAYSILHPKQDGCGYPFDDLTGSAVAFKLASAILQTIENEKSDEIIFNLLDFASMGTIADMGQLIDENRYIVKEGLKKLSVTKRPGLKALKNHSGLANKEISAQDVGFQLSPRINAAGRIGNPYRALSLMIQDQEDAKTMRLAQILEEYNNDRKLQTQSAIEEAKSMLSDEDVIILKSKNWTAGILGLIAGRLADQFGKPAFIMQEREGDIVGSARCPDFFNVTEALSSASDFLTGFGGHQQAAGFSLPLENFTSLKKTLESFTKEQNISEQKPTISVECILNEKDLSIATYNAIQQIAPFGVGNPEPIFLLTNITPQDLRQIGSQKNHLKFKAHNVDVIAFNYGEHFETFSKEEHIDLLVSLDLNTWNGNTNLQLRLVDARSSS